MPVEVVGLKIGENRMIGLKCFYVIRHETRNLEDDISLLQSPLRYHLDRFGKWDIEIPGEKNLFFPVFLFQKVVKNPCSRGLSVRPCDGEYLEPFRKETIDEIKLAEDLPHPVNPVRRRNTGRWDNGFVTEKILSIVRIVHHLRRDAKILAKRFESISNFPLPINANHKNLKKMDMYGIIGKI